MTSTASSSTAKETNTASVSTSYFKTLTKTYAKAKVPNSILNAFLNILTSISQSQNTIYLYSQSIDFIIDMSIGTDVQVDLYTGEEELFNTLPIRNFIPGIWSSPLKISRTYRYPGDYKVKAVISNSVSAVVLTQQITVMSNVSGLIVELKNSPVIYFHQSTDDSGRAYFQFKYQGITCAASHSNVSFTVGDSNTNYGPFWLGMDFPQNISKTPFFHDYDTIGSYTATFTVQNEISSKTLILQILVVEAIYGVHLQVLPPNCFPSMSFINQAFIEQGNNISLEWIIENNPIGVFKRTGNKDYQKNRKSHNFLLYYIGQTYLQADQINFNTSNVPDVYHIVLIARDQYLTINRSYYLETQENIIISLNTLPIILVDNESKKISEFLLN